MIEILIDTGSILAALNRQDKHHRFAVDTMRQYNQPLITTVAVMTEAMYLTQQRLGWYAAEKLLEIVNRGDIVVQHINLTDFQRIAVLMKKYLDLPMDFADATLVAVAERLNCKRIFTIDTRDFHVYRYKDNLAFDVICP
jgi:uncharacterized protein